ncbi:hypothetical protein E6H11_04235 [Candidatus Bathyarchaeota archaeon]|nr:MAG: hypothetical protein E6H11_04235 [Candidatus Bathyarchaeota archaeon]
MEKLKILLIMLVSATGGLAVSGYILALILTPTESALEVLSQLLTKGFPATFPFLVLFSSLLFLSTVLASVVGVIYFLVLPEMKTYYAPGNGNGRENTAMVLKTLKPEERSIVNVLDAHGGTYLQKYITREAGLSRLKTHRVVAALSERGIVQVEKRGNTNQVRLAKWFHDSMHQP